MLNDLFADWYKSDEKKLKPKWCKVCGRKHPRNEACKLVKKFEEGFEGYVWTPMIGESDESIQGSRSGRSEKV